MTKHWPEFGAQEGKELITVADVMRHEGGMPQFNQQLDIEDRCKVKTAAQWECVTWISIQFISKSFSFPENIARNGVGRVIQEETPSWPEGEKRLVVCFLFALFLA